jgi:predicted metal-binding protein
MAAPATVSSEQAPQPLDLQVREGGAGIRSCEPGDLPCVDVSNGRRRGGLGVSDDRFPCTPPSCPLAIESVGMSPASMSAPGAEPGATIFICVTCRHGDEQGVRPGKILFDAVEARLAAREAGDVALQAVECLSVCKRPCTVALSAPGKWTYVVGDLDTTAHPDDVIEAAVKFAATPDGIVPWRERPQSFRKGIVSRVPPLPVPPREA